MRAHQQFFPRRVNGQIERYAWTVDLERAQRFCRDKRFTRARLDQELSDMEEHFPRWVLSLARGEERILCKACAGVLVFDDGLRCAVCGQAKRAGPWEKKSNLSLAWFGLLPPIGVDGLKKMKRALSRKAPPQHLFGHRPDLGHYLLVPLVARYPADFPQSPVEVNYLPGFFEIAGTPALGASHAYHMFGGGMMCLFAGGQWQRETSCREVLQQRAFPHVIKLLNYSNGKKSAFAVVS